MLRENTKTLIGMADSKDYSTHYTVKSDFTSKIPPFITTTLGFDSGSLINFGKQVTP